MAKPACSDRSARPAYTAALLAALASTTTAMAQAPGAIDAAAPQPDLSQSKGASSSAPGSTAAAPIAASNKTTEDLQEVVVTANPTYGGLKKLDAGYSVTTLSEEALKEANSTSTADLLKASPGVYPEGSGGETGANVEIAGFPGSSGSPFVTVGLNGAPLFPGGGVSLLEESSLLRLDDTVERAELVQGGPAVLYGAGQPGLFANFILKRGTDTPTGDLGFTYGSEGSERVDGFVGFPIIAGSGWYGSVGGFWRESDGVRDPQYKADDGGQLTGTLSRKWDSGSLVLYARYLNDKNQFVTDTPVLNPGVGQFSPYPGFNPLTGTLGSRADQYEFLETTPCNTPGCKPGGIPGNLADGRGPKAVFSGADFDWDFGNGWSVSNKLAFSSGIETEVALYSAGNPTTLGSYIASAEAADKLPGGLAATATYTNNGAAANMNQNVLTQGYWYGTEKFQALSNEVHISGELFPGNTLTVGNYTVVDSANLLIYEGSDLLLQAQNNPSPIAISLSNGTNTWQLASPSGFVTGNTAANAESGTGLNTALILSDSWKLGPWLFDAGFREEHEHISSHLGHTGTGDLDDDPYTLYNNTSRYLSGGQSNIYYSKAVPSWTAGVNYEITQNMSAYLRFNDGVHLPSITDTTSALLPPVEKIHNMEVGFKFQQDWIYTSLSLFRRIFTGVPSSLLVDVGNTTETVYYIYGSEANGVTFDTTLRPFKNFTLAVSGDYMDGKYTHSNGCFTYQGQTTVTQCVASDSFDGYQLARQPDFQTRVTPAYTLPMDWGFLRAWTTYEYVGTHFGDQQEQQPLGHYYDLAFGLVADVGPNWEFRVQGTNLTDQIGLTEGNARVLIGPANANGIILGRSIEGREVNFQVKYRF
jgi:outer membrane receptor protein involved in Fe transport